MTVWRYTPLWLAFFFCGVAVAADEDMPLYELSLEKARRLHDLLNLVEQAEQLQAMNRVDTYIRTTACAADYLEVSEATAELRQMDQRRQSGDPAQRLSRDERAWYNQQVKRRVTSLNAFNDCYRNHVDGNATHIFPPSVRSHSGAVRHTQYLEHTYRDFDFKDTLLDETLTNAREEIEQIETEPAFIAKITKLTGDVQIGGPGGWRRAQQGRALQRDEEIRTGKQGLVEIELYDYDPVENKGPTIMELTPASHLALNQFAVALERQKRSAESRTMLERAVNLLRGKVIAFTRGWGGSIFSVRAGTTVCGSRATHFVVEYNPELDEGRFELIEGVIDVTSNRGEVHTLRPGQTVRVVGNEFRFGGGLPQ